MAEALAIRHHRLVGEQRRIARRRERWERIGLLVVPSPTLVCGLNLRSPFKSQDSRYPYNGTEASEEGIGAHGIVSRSTRVSRRRKYGVGHGTESRLEPRSLGGGSFFSSLIINFIFPKLAESTRVLHRCESVKPWLPRLFVIPLRYLDHQSQMLHRKKSSRVRQGRLVSRQSAV
jgi:hypothetical protein